MLRGGVGRGFFIMGLGVNKFKRREREWWLR